MNDQLNRQFAHLDPAWVDSVALELIGRGGDGRSVGEALAVADAHCADSGETAQEAFGTPREYADAVHLRPEDVTARQLGHQLKVARGSLIGLIGMTLAFRVTTAHLDGGPVAVTVGDVLSIVGILAFAIILVRSLRLLIRHRVASGLVAGVAAVGIVLGPILLTHVLFTMPVVVAAVISAATLIASGIVSTLTIEPQSPIIDPRSGTPAAPGNSRLFIVFTNWLFVSGTAIGVGVVLLIDRLAS